MRHFDDWIRGYLDYTSHLEAPPSFHMWTAVATVAGALRGKCWVDMGYFRWKPNFFVILVAPPGVVNKSTTSGIGMSLLREVDGIHFGPNSVTWQALTQSFAENIDNVVMGVDENGESKVTPMSCITIEASELGTFLDMRNREMVDVLVDLWDGRNIPWTRKTKGGGEERIPSPWINLIAGTTPSWIAENMPEYAIGGGFTSRSIFVYGDTKAKLVAYPRLCVPKDFEEIRSKLISDLQRISDLRGEFTLSQEAHRIGEEWYREHWMSPPEHLSDDRLSGYAARKQTHIHKLAMVLSACRRDDLVITEREFTDALMFLGAIEDSIMKVFNAITNDQDVKNLGLIMHLIRRTYAKDRKPLPKSDVFRLLSVRMTYASFELALQSAIHAGHVKQEQNGQVLTLIPLSH